MGIFWKSKRNIKNTSDNNITISTSTDIMFNIGKELGEIKTFIEQANYRFNDIYNELKTHKKRIKKLEQIVNNEKNF